MDKGSCRGLGFRSLCASALTCITVLFALAGANVATAADRVATSVCDGGAVEVQNATSDELSLICKAAGTAVDYLSSCGLRLQSRLVVEVADEPIRIGGFDVFGCFDAEMDTIRLLGLESCAQAAAANRTYAALPADLFYRSIVVHEVAHSLFRSNLGKRFVPRAGHEYVAYAVQITLMPETERRQFLSPIKRSAPSDLSRFADMLLLIAPEAFAAMAYDHFAAPGNGCRLLQDLLTESRSFPVPDKSLWLE